MDKEIVISIKTVAVLIAFLVGAWIVLKILPVIVALFVSLLLALMLTPFVDWGQEKGVPRGVSASALYLLLLSIFGSVGVAGVKPIISQMRKLLELLPSLIESILGLQNQVLSAEVQNFLTGQLDKTSGNVVSATLGAFSNVLFILSILVFTFYLLVEFDEVKKLFVGLFPASKRKDAKSLVIRIEKQLGAYLRGQLILGLIVGLMTYIGLRLLNVDFALSLAIFAGVLEIVPVIGPIISAIPTLIVSLTGGLWMFVGVLLLYIIVQQLENNLLVPKVMEKTVGFNPLVTLILLLIGGTLFGGLGIILAIPTSIVIYLSFQELFVDLFEM